MRTRIYWNADSRQVFAALQAVEDFLKSPKAALEEFARYTKRQHMKALRGRYDPATGKPWKPLAASTIAQRQTGKTGRKRKGVRMATTLYAEVEKNGVVVGYRSPIAAIQHRGAKIPARTIVPKNKKALYWVGASHPVSRVNQPAYSIPARPLVGFSPLDLFRFREEFRTEIDRIWNDNIK